MLAAAPAPPKADVTESAKASEPAREPSVGLRQSSAPSPPSVSAPKRASARAPPLGRPDDRREPAVAGPVVRPTCRSRAPPVMAAMSGRAADVAAAVPAGRAAAASAAPSAGSVGRVGACGTESAAELSRPGVVLRPAASAAVWFAAARRAAAVSSRRRRPSRTRSRRVFQPRGATTQPTRHAASPSKPRSTPGIGPPPAAGAPSPAAPPPAAPARIHASAPVPGRAVSRPMLHRSPRIGSHACPSVDTVRRYAPAGTAGRNASTAEPDATARDTTSPTRTRSGVAPSDAAGTATRWGPAPPSEPPPPSRAVVEEGRASSMAEERYAVAESDADEALATRRRAAVGSAELRTAVDAARGAATGT